MQDCYSEVWRLIYDNYKLQYVSDGRHVEYRSLQVDRFDPVAVPVPMINTGLNNGYRDPNSFRYNAFEKAQVSSPKPIDFTAGT